MKYHNKYREFFDNQSLQDDLKKASIRGGVYTFAAGGISFFFRLGSIAILARILIPEYFGLLSMVTALTVIADRFKDLGLSLAIVQKKEITHEQVSQLFWINFAIGLIITVIFCAISKVMGRFYSDNRITWITVAIATTFFWGGITVQHHALLWRKMEYFKISAINIGADIFSISLAIFLAVRGYGYWALVWREVTRSIFIAIATWIACPWIPGLPKKDTGIVGMIRFGRDITIFNIINCFTANLDHILLGKFYGANLLGIYKQGSQLVSIPIDQLTSPVQFVAQSTLSRLQNDDIKYRHYYRKIVSLLSFATMPLAVFLFVHSTDIILLVLGEKWTEAVEIFRIFALKIFIRPVTFTLGCVMTTCGETRRNLFLGLADSILIICSIVVGLKWGAVGIAAGQTIENYIFFLPLVFLALKNTPISVEIFFRSILPPVVSSLLMGSILFIFCIIMPVRGNLNAIMSSLAIGIVVYFGASILMPGGKTRLWDIFSDFVFTFRKSASG